MNLAGIEIDSTSRIVLIAGPCVIETEAISLKTAECLKRVSQSLQVPVIFKSSFRKGNRTSLGSYSGPGIEAGLRTLERVRDEFGLPVLTDVHEDSPLDEVAAVVDVLQTPALLCRQTSFILSVAAMQKPVNLKKGQFLSPEEMLAVVEKARTTGNRNLMICERGTSFGYNDLVADMRGLITMRAANCPIIFDASHSVQRPGLSGVRSGGDRVYTPALARAAVAVGVAGVFLETHPDPSSALCDSDNAWPLAKVEALLEQLVSIDDMAKRMPFADPVIDR